MILVTGANGLIGRALMERLLSSGQELRLQVRDRTKLKLPDGTNGRVEVREADFEQTGERDFQRLVEGCDTVIHTAALVHQPAAPFHAYECLNVRTTNQLAGVAAASGVKTFVFFSTIGVYGEGPFENVGETAPIRPVTPYAVSKANSEQELAKLQGLSRVIVLRPVMTFGEGERGNLLKFIEQLKKGRFLFLGQKPVLKSLIYCRDVAKATQICLSSLPEGFHTLNVSNPEAVTLTELTQMIALGLGRTAGYPTVPEPLARLVIKTAESLLGSRSPVKWEQVERLNTTTTVSVRQLVEKTGFAPEWNLKDALDKEIKWATGAGVLKE